MIHPPKKAEQVDRPPDTRTLPPTFDPAYVEGVVKPFFLSAKYEGEPPLLPMIDVALSKEAAIPAHIFGMLYDNWTAKYGGGGSHCLPSRVREARTKQREKEDLLFSCHAGPVWSNVLGQDKTLP